MNSKLSVCVNPTSSYGGTILPKSTTDHETIDASYGKLLNHVVNYFIISNHIDPVEIGLLMSTCNVTVSKEVLATLLEFDEQKRFCVFRKPSYFSTDNNDTVDDIHRNGGQYAEFVQVTDNFCTLYKNVISSVQMWKYNLSDYIRKQNTLKYIDLSLIGQTFPRPNDVPSDIKLIEVLENMNDGRYEITRQDSKVYIRYNLSEDEVEEVISRWRDDVSEYLLSVPGYSANIGDIGKIVQRPKMLSKAHKLSLILSSDPKSRFRLIGKEGCSEIVVERTIDWSEFEHLIESWKNDIIFHLQESDKLYVDLGTLGSISARPVGLPRDIKLSQVLSQDQQHRFVIKDLHGIPGAGLRPSYRNKITRNHENSMTSHRDEPYDPKQSMFSSSYENGMPLMKTSDHSATINLSTNHEGRWTQLQGEKSVSKPSGTSLWSHEKAEVLSKHSSENIARQLESWKRQIIPFLFHEKGAVDLTYVGASIPRPKGLPGSIKMKDILIGDKRFSVSVSQPSKVFVSLNPTMLPSMQKLISSAVVEDLAPSRVVTGEIRGLDKRLANPQISYATAVEGPCEPIGPPPGLKLPRQSSFENENDPYRSEYAACLGFKPDDIIRSLYTDTDVAPAPDLRVETTFPRSGGLWPPPYAHQLPYHPYCHS